MGEVAVDVLPSPKSQKLVKVVATEVLVNLTMAPGQLNVLAYVKLGTGSVVVMRLTLVKLSLQPEASVTTSFTLNVPGVE